jgi:predicted alpha/beta superfamily hydrolase
MLRSSSNYSIPIFTLAILFSLASVAQTPAPKNAQECKHTITGDVEIFDFTSKVFANTRKIRAFLPPGYNDAANKDRKYPVLYMFDGQNLFDACTSFDHVHEWQIDETVTRLVNEGRIDPLIVIGIDNGQEKRASEYLAWKDGIQQPFMDEPNGRMLPTFMLQEVMPAMAKKYRIETDKPGMTAIGGSSYGGVAALYVALSAPMVFTKVIAESPVLFIGNNQIVRDTTMLALAPEKVFMGIGGEEASSDNGVMLKAMQQVEKNLKSAAANRAEVLLVVDEPSHHNEQAWAKRFPEAIAFLFPAKKTAPAANDVKVQK